MKSGMSFPQIGCKSQIISRRLQLHQHARGIDPDDHPATMAPEFRLQNEPRLVDFRRCRDNRPAPVWDRRLVAKLARGNRQSGECDPERINPGGSVNGPQHPGGNTDSPYDIRDILKVVLRTSPL